MIKNFLFLVALLLGTATYAQADACTGWYLQGDIDQLPYTDGDSAIDIPHLVKVKLVGSSSTSIQYIEPHLSQGYYVAILPFCGELTVSIILDPVSDGNGGYEGVKVGNLPNLFPSIYGGYTWSFTGLPYTTTISAQQGPQYRSDYLIGV